MIPRRDRTYTQPVDRVAARLILLGVRAQVERAGEQEWLRLYRLNAPAHFHQLRVVGGCVKPHSAYKITQAIIRSQAINGVLNK